ncbi:MAG: RDD family protein, partial [Actinomycetota bacterium]|nr:RDD family protein [Actinomycetota bacterium]
MAGLVTGEAVLLDLRPARLASRLLAALLDGLLLLLLVVVAAFLLSRVPLELDPAASAAVATVLFVGVVVGYPTLWEVLTRGRTPGKMALGLRVVRDDGGPVRFRQVFTRALTLLFDVPTLYVFSLVVQVLSERGKRLGDVLAGTFVVTERVPSAVASAALPMPPPLASWAAGLDLSGLPDDLALTVRQFLGRAPALAPAAREEIGRRLAAAVTATTSPPPPAGTPGWAYLAAVLA